jgi:putative acetyltransferase
MTLAIRIFAPDDLNHLLAVFFEAVHGSTDYTESQRAAWAPATPDRAHWLHRLTTTQCLVAIEDEALAGFGNRTTDGVIDLLYVHPDHQHRGIASSLLRLLEARARECGLTELRTEASITARPVFEGQGYRWVKEQSKAFNGERFVTYAMVKSIEQSRLAPHEG